MSQVVEALENQLDPAMHQLVSYSRTFRVDGSDNTPDLEHFMLRSQLRIVSYDMQKAILTAALTSKACEESSQGATGGGVDKDITSKRRIGSLSINTPTTAEDTKLADLEKKHQTGSTKSGRMDAFFVKQSNTCVNSKMKASKRKNEEVSIQIIIIVS